MAWTQAKESKKEDIESRLKTIGGDMLKIEYLENCLKQPLTLDVRKFVHLQVAQLYEGKLMYAEAAKNLNGAAEISVTFREKMELYMKEAGMYVTHGSYDKADEAFGKALACGNTKEKEELKKRIKEIYLSKAREFERLNRLNNAIKIYEKVRVHSYVSEDEKRAINAKLIPLYNKVGKIQEAMRLEGK